MNTPKSSSPFSSALVTVADLLTLQDRWGDRLLVLDASVPPVVPGYESLNPVDPSAPWLIIPSARRFDYDKRFCDPDASLPHMLPTPRLFEREARSLGINQGSIIVVYDDAGVYASPRGWWMLRAMGHEHVAVLDGGLRAWLAAGQVTAEGDAEWRAGAHSEQGDFTAQAKPSAFVDSAVVLEALSDPLARVLDARSTARFNAEAPEPRPGVRGGHMPGAHSFPFPRLLNGQVMKPAEALRAEFAAVAAPDHRLVTSCGSGLTACVLALGAELAGYTNLSVYDGSWADWGADESLPVVGSESEAFR